MLVDVDKADVLDRLEPLTRKHYDEFRRCEGCGQVYWRGSHHRQLVQLVERIRSAGPYPPPPGVSTTSTSPA